MRVFAYVRCSTHDQTNENQIVAIRSAGFDIPDHRIVSEVVSGGVVAMKRPAFRSLVEHKLEPGDTLVVLRLDRLGRDNIDVQQTIDLLLAKGVSVSCLDLPVRNLSSAEGRLVLQLMSCFAEFEKARIRERTLDGLNRAKAQGKRLGRPVATTWEQVQELKRQGLSQSKAAERLKCSKRTAARLWNDNPGK